MSRASDRLERRPEPPRPHPPGRVRRPAEVPRTEQVVLAATAAAWPRWLIVPILVAGIGGAALIVVGAPLAGGVLLGLAVLAAWLNGTVSGLRYIREFHRGEVVVLPDGTVTPMEGARMENHDFGGFGGGGDSGGGGGGGGGG